MKRRQFLKYAGVSAAAIGVSVLGLDYLTRPQSLPVGNTSTTQPSTSSGTSAVTQTVSLSSNSTSTASALESLNGLLDPIRGPDLVGLGSVGVRRLDATKQVQQNDQWHLGSDTKSMTATLIAMLVERGKLGWETTIADVFPDLLNGIQPAFHNLTLIELLSHRAGIPGNDKGQQTYSYMENQLWDLTGPLTQQRRAVVELVLSEPPVSTPGSMFNYSNLGYIIAGAFAEQVTGEQWEQLMQQMLFQPLGMDNSGFGPPGTPGALDEPLGHTSSCQPLQPWSTRPPADNPPVLGPAGTVHSSMSDWARYASLHLLGAQGQRGLLLTPASFQVLHNDQYHQGYALGWFVANRDWAQGLTLSHNGSNTLWYADIWIAPTRNAALMTATNTADCPSQGVGFNACDAAISTMVGIYLQ